MITRHTYGRTHLLLLLISCLFVCLNACSNGPSVEPFWLGADISGVTGGEAMGDKLYGYEDDEPVEATALMKELGLNAVRLRVWVNPTRFGFFRDASNDSHAGLCDKEDVLEQALRAKALGMEVMIDFHYSDSWADPGKQPIPKAWLGHSYDEMREDLKAHTVEVLSLLKDNGVEPRWVQVGNETRNGLLWSVKTDEHGWELKDENGNTTMTDHMGHSKYEPEQYAGFIDAGYEGVKSVFPKATVIVHLDNGYDSLMYDQNLGILEKYGARYDMVGMSLYPYWHHKAKGEAADQMIADCMKNVDHVWRRFGRESMIVETGVEVDEQNPANMTESIRQMALIAQSARMTPHCLGLFYWNPTCRPGGYRLGAFGSDRRPTDIMRAFCDRGSAFATYAVRSLKEHRRFGARYHVPLDSIVLSDPCILADTCTQTYFMTGTGGMLWKSRDLRYWDGPFSAADTDPDSWMGPRPMIWAAELHPYKGKYYYFATFTNRAVMIDTVGGTPIERRACHVLVSDHAYGPYRPMADETYLEATRPTLDGTFWVDTDGKPYMVFCHEWLQNGNGTVEKIELKPDLSGTVGESTVLFRAFDSPWSREQHADGTIGPNKVTDGPYLFRTGTGRLGMIWTSWRFCDYTQGVAYSESGTLDGPWTQEPEPITPPNFGHGMLFRDLNGQWLMSVHSHASVEGRTHRVPHLFHVDLTGDRLVVGEECEPSE